MLKLISLVQKPNNSRSKAPTSRSTETLSVRPHDCNGAIKIKELPIVEHELAVKIDTVSLGIQPYHVKDKTIVKPRDKEPSIFKLIHDKLVKDGNDGNSSQNKNKKLMKNY
jgi:hypothetical protein